LDAKTIEGSLATGCFIAAPEPLVLQQPSVCAAAAKASLVQ
jgi:hypothetical protein